MLFMIMSQTLSSDPCLFFKIFLFRSFQMAHIENLVVKYNALLTLGLENVVSPLLQSFNQIVLMRSIIVAEKILNQQNSTC